MPIPLPKKKKTLRVLLQLLFLLGVAAYMVSLLVERSAPRRQRKELWSQREGFFAVSVGALSRDDKGPHLSRGEFRRLLDALDRAGYETLTTEDLRAFYEEDAPLPDRAVYVMFEGGRKDGAIYGQEALVLAGQRANMFVYTGLASGWNHTFLNRDQIGTMGKSAYWDVGSNGHHAYIESNRRRTFYLGDYLRDSSGRRTETPAEYVRRAGGDFDESVAVLEKLLGEKPEAFILMPANSVDNSLDAEMSAVLRALVAEHYKLAFLREGVAYNARSADPRDLNRLRIDKRTTADWLVRNLEGWLPGFRTYSLADDPEAARWYADAGRTARSGGGFVLEGDAGHGAFAWLAGSDGWENLEFDLGLAPPPDGEAAVYFRYAGRRSFVRLVFRSGTVSVQERDDVRGLLHLAERELPAGGAVSVRARVLNDRLWLSANGTPLFDVPVHQSVSHPGRLAIGVGFSADSDAEAGAGEAPALPVSDLAVRPLPELWKAVASTALESAPIGGAGDATAFLVEVGNALFTRGQVAALLRAANAGLARHAVLSPGLYDLNWLGRIPAGVPARLGAGLWTGVVFQPVGDDWPALAAAAAAARKRGLSAGVRIDSRRAATLSRLEEPAPLDAVVLSEPVDELIATALKRRYRTVLFADGAGAYAR